MPTSACGARPPRQRARAVLSARTKEWNRDALRRYPSVADELATHVGVARCTGRHTTPCGTCARPHAASRAGSHRHTPPSSTVVPGRSSGRSGQPPSTARSRRPCGRPTPGSRPIGLEWRCGDGHTEPAQPMRGGRGDSLAVRSKTARGLRGSFSLGRGRSTQIGRPRHPMTTIRPAAPLRCPHFEGDEWEGDGRSDERLQEGDAAVIPCCAPESRAS
jgi:hypothetical protein